MPRHGSATAGEPEPAVQAPAPRRGLASWPIRRKLITLVAGPLVLILGAGVFFTAQSVSSLRAAQRARDLANVALLTNQLVSSLNNELSRTITHAKDRTAIAPKRAMVQSRTVTDLAYQRLRDALDDQPGGSWSPDVESQRTRLDDVSTRLPFVRRGVDRGNANLVIQSGYTKQLQATLALTNALGRDLSTSARNAETVDAASTLSALAAAASAAVQETVRLTTALQELRLSDRTDLGLIELKVTQDTQLTLAESHATPDQRIQLTAIRWDDNRIEEFRRSALLAARSNSGVRTQKDIAVSRTEASNYTAAAGERIKALDALVANVATSTRADADANARAALLETGVVASLALLSLLLASALVTLVARTVTVPMRRLRAGAVDAATVRLPAMVRQIEREGPDSLVALPPVLPPGTQAGPETIEVAQAVDGLTSEAVRLASAQVRLRQALDEAFVSMSRRSQSMVEKQLAIIDELESTEEDPEQLRNLFRLDHLAARMRRYNDNLLVLAGSALRTRSAAPVPIADVFRAATSEMEQYERVRLQPVNGVAISGPVAGGLVHLLAELLDNAAMYSPPTSPILLAGSLTPDGGLHLEITDSGVGIPASELADLNARLAMPGSIDTQVPSRMGLYVVARLAQRGGFTVRLAPRAQAAGTVAEVSVPASMVVGRQGQPLPAGRPGQPGEPGQPQPGGPGQLLPPGQQGQPAQPAQLGLAGRNSGGPLAPGQLPSPLVPLGLAGRGSEPGTEGGGGDSTGRPDLPLPTRSPAATGGMRLNPALRLTTGPAGTTAPRGVPLPPLGEPAEAHGSAPEAAPAEVGQAAGLPEAPAAPQITAGHPTLPIPPAPPGQTPELPAASAGPSVAGRLPSRRPGAALAGNPLGGSAGIDPPFGSTAAPTRPDPAARLSPPVLPPAPQVPAGPVTPRFEAPKSGDLPRRTRGSALAGTPLAGPPSGPVPLNGAAASEMFGAGAAAVAEEPPEERALQAPPLAGAQADDALAASAAPSAEAGPAIDRSDPTSAPDLPAAEPDPGRRPIRPFAQPRQAPPRPPFRPGATGAQVGASAATAAAAAARARAESGGRQPGPGTGLFATTGPATLPGGVARPAVAAPGDDGGRPEDAAPSAPGTGPLARPPVPPAPIVDDVGAMAAGRPELPELPGLPGDGLDISTTELEAMAATAGRYLPLDPDAPMIGSPDAAVDEPNPIFDSISAWFSTDTPPARESRPMVIDLRDDAEVPALVQQASSAGPAGSGTSRWAALGDQEWMATNARAAAGPSVAGNTDSGLPRRQPGANLLPSAAQAAPAVRSTPGRASAPAASVTPSAASGAGGQTRPDAAAVRGRLGSYQRGLTSARRARHLPGTTTTRPTIGESEAGPPPTGHEPADQGGEH